jgi:transketolase
LNEPADRARIIILDTIKGRGVPGFENQMSSHYLPLDAQTFAAALSELEAL